MEAPIVFDCEGSALLGILNLPYKPPRRGVIFVVADGPQYRVGAQRQFVVLARSMQAQGYAALRFDYRGMGDSEGVHRGFMHVDSDIRAAVDALLAHAPSVEELVLWGECDSSAAVLFYAHKDPRIKGISIANPWVRTEESRAKTMVKHYYGQRLLQGNFWKKLITLEFDYRASLASLWRNILFMVKPGHRAGEGFEQTEEQAGAEPLPNRLEAGLRKFSGPVLLVLSGRDWIATEFLEVVASSPAWQELLAAKRVTRHEIAGADHSFSKREWRDELIRHNCQWMSTW